MNDMQHFCETIIGQVPLRIPRVLVLSVLVFTVLVACSEEPVQDATEEVVRKADGTIRIGDRHIYEGRISQGDEAFEFRACEMDESYFVDASFSINDTLDTAIQTQSAFNRMHIYVRFHGEVITGVDGLSDRYADVVRIIELLSYDASVPVECK